MLFLSYFTLRRQNGGHQETFVVTPGNMATGSQQTDVNELMHEKKD